MKAGTKRCGACKRDLPRSAFASNRAKRDGLASQCRECKKRTQAEWYQRHRETHLRNVRAHSVAARKERRRRLFEYLLTHPCVDCGERRPYMLDFDHRSGGARKEALISRVRSDWSWERMLREIEKCDVRCANCHRARHAKEENSTMYRLWTEYVSGL